MNSAIINDSSCDSKSDEYSIFVIGRVDALNWLEETLNIYLITNGYDQRVFFFYFRRRPEFPTDAISREECKEEYK